ncbi:MAG: hypothetical protein U0074_00930 [Kouleothrix sp.]
MPGVICNRIIRNLRVHQRDASHVNNQEVRARLLGRTQQAMHNLSDTLIIPITPISGAISTIHQLHWQNWRAQILNGFLRYLSSWFVEAQPHAPAGDRSLAEE